MKKWFRSSLRNQLTVFILVAVLLPIYLLGLFSYLIAVDVAKERAMISGNSSLEQLETTLEFIMNDVENMSVFLIGNEDVQQYLQVGEDTVKLRSDIYGFLSNLALSKPYIANILIEPFNKNPDISTLPILSSTKLYSEQYKSGKWWFYNHEDEMSIGSKELITLWRPIRSTDTYDLIGYLSISLDQQVIEEHLSATNFEWNGSVLLMFEGKVLAGNDESFENTNALKEIYSLVENHADSLGLTYQSEDMKSMILSQSLSDVGWRLIGIIPFDEYSQQNQYFLWLTVIAVGVACILVSVLVLFFIRRVFRPLTSLTAAIRNQQPEYDIEKLPTYSNDEVGQLIESYKNLYERIQTLMEDLKKNESLKREVDLQALQAQINPHFLYNTLASVHWMALDAEQKKISAMVSSLSNFLRYSLNEGNEYCTVEQELAHLANYAEIQKIRYPNSFKLDIMIPDEVKQMYMLKLLLQPLIENSIIHAFLQDDGQPGQIKVVGKWDEKYLQISVADNGQGMSVEHINQLHEQFTIDEKSEVLVGKGYGLRNVNLRLFLNYGPASRLLITSSPGNGTIVQFSVPLKRG
ncbi:sensor histidine kinase [Ferdinandcohnia quinoae]|uniref:histidine kinase n=1 Tax=Fredinandcohnia quinoae TaxID=2918902 RepID=A0AAW5ECB1_9BACI|nr:sensor histidine kinase [Fredinandcohnia sp. SECRCQ15]MCH1627696.1 sensor histidine kinase [Fredinandcohnia sp. SECRCQ15]